MTTKYYLTNKNGSQQIFLSTNPSNIFSIGRIPNNSLQILDTTVSKNHALIYFLSNQNKFVLQDLGSINGTFVNNNQIVASKIYLKTNDSIQFGKNDQIYYFKNSNPEPLKKGKVNFKDYYFELQQAIDVKPVLTNKKNNQRITQGQINSNHQINNTFNQKNNQNEQSKKTKQKFQRAIKIPKFQQFLEIQADEFIEDKQKKQQQKSLYKKNNQQPRIQKRGIKLPQLNKNQLNEQDKMLKNMIERKRQLQKAQKQILLKKAQQEQRILEEKLKLQIQKSQQQQKILREKYQIQKKTKQSQRNLEKQKLINQERLKLKQKEMNRKQEIIQMSLKQKQQQLLQQMAKQKQYQLLKLRQRERQLIKQLQEQKNRQISEIKSKESQKRQKQEQKYRQQLENRKRQLQVEAQALAKQYQNIYKQTVKKMKLNIETEKQKLIDLEKDIQKIENQNRQIIECLSIESNQLQNLNEIFFNINGRNKAFLLYASHLQSKIDLIKAQQLQNNAQKNPTNKTSFQLKQSIKNCRKLLNLKINEKQQLQNQIKQSFLNLNVLSVNNQDYFNTILENYQQIQRLKQFYFEYLQQEKSLSEKWDLKLQENNQIEQKVRNTKKQLQNNKKKINDDLNQHLKKITQQRVHMLKMLQYVPEQKKNAAKFLVQEMLNIQQQNKAIIINSQNTHSLIMNLILQTQDKKRQNQELSHLLFGTDSTSHHFDNMKQHINRLIQQIDNQKQHNKIFNTLKTSEQIRTFQNKIYLESKRQKKLKQSLKNNEHVIPSLNSQKNPLVFFGNLLMKKQKQLQLVQQEEKKLQKKINQTKSKILSLTNKKNKMNNVLQEFKKKELSKIRSILN